MSDRKPRPPVEGDYNDGWNDAVDYFKIGQPMTDAALPNWRREVAAIVEKTLEPTADAVLWEPMLKEFEDAARSFGERPNTGIRLTTAREAITAFLAAHPAPGDDDD